MTELVLQSNAKINLGLRILRKQNDGYHELETVFQEVDFGDTLTFQRLTIPEFVLESTDPHLPTDDSNLCAKAFHLLQERYPQVQGVKISLEKRIPVGAGLGGGSSNAATTLLGLSKLFGLPISKNELLDLATQLGADVPFFLYGATAHATGIGEQITPIHPVTNFKIVIVAPDISISTRWAYENIRLNLTSKPMPFNFKGFFDIAELTQLLVNDFEPLVQKKYSEIGDIKERLFHLHADLVSLSGSGSAIFGLYSDSVAAQNAVTMLSHSYFCQLTSPLQRENPRMNDLLGDSW